MKNKINTMTVEFETCFGCENLSRVNELGGRVLCKEYEHEEIKTLYFTRNAKIVKGRKTESGNIIIFIPHRFCSRQDLCKRK